MKYNTTLATWHLQQAFIHVGKAEKVLGKLAKRPTISHFILESKRGINALLLIDLEQIQQIKDRKERPANEIH